MTLTTGPTTDDDVRAAAPARLRGATSGWRGGRRRAARCRASSHAEFAPAPDRPDPLALLEEQARHPRAGAAARSATGAWRRRPFAFFRGAALPMASDLAARRGRGSRRRSAGTPTCPTSACSPLRSAALVFDINDFDETLPGPVGVGRQAARDQPGDRRPRPTATRPRSAATSCSPRSRRTGARCGGSPGMDALDVWYAHADVDAIAGCRRRRR